MVDCFECGEELLVDQDWKLRPDLPPNKPAREDDFIHEKCLSDYVEKIRYIGDRTDELPQKWRCKECDGEFYCDVDYKVPAACVHCGRDITESEKIFEKVSFGETENSQ